MKFFKAVAAFTVLPQLNWAQTTTSPRASSSLTVSSSVSSSTASANAVPIIQVNSRPVGTLNATAWALIYTYPLYIFSNFAGNVLRSVAVNQFLHQANLASVDSPGVIKPNVDTTYSRVVLDLSTNDLILTIPNVTDRYYVYPIIDAFGNIISEIGVVNNNTAGDYLIRRADDVFGPAGLQYASNSSAQLNTAATPANASRYAGIVNLPTTFGTILVRFLVRENTTADLDIIHGYQNASKLTPIPRNVTRGLAPSGGLLSLAPNGTFLGIDTPEKLLNLSARLILYNQPELYTERQRVAGILGQAGIYSGSWNPPSGVNLTLAASIANASITADINNSTNVRDEGNDWRLSTEAYQGNFGINYASRAYVAIAGYQQQTVVQTLYPGWKALGFTSQASLAPNTSLLFTFSGKPRLARFGFWSVTVYGADQYLIPNPVNRFEIGDRSTNLTYQRTGRYVYGSRANASDDGPFQVLVQRASQVPPANWTGNWLPTSQDFSFITRWYTPLAAMTNGSYVYPKVEVINAIL